MNSAQIRQFQKTIWDYYEKHGRVLPWRRTKDPYRILVSEIMLQQTQVDRVQPKYQQWLREFPSFSALATAPVPKVLRAWQGLGYNRRALYLHRTAQIVTDQYKGKLRADLVLELLPGIGKYTAAAIRAFAFNQPAVLIETNIRTVYLHFFFPDQTGITDAQLLLLIEQTIDTKNPRQWYWALMDYGAMLKKQIGNASINSAHYTKQSKFQGSLRQVRGRVLAALLENPKLTNAQLQKYYGFDKDKIKTARIALRKEGLIFE